MSALDKAKYLSFIDAGISNIWSLSLPGHLESLNLHGNYIQNISNLSHMTRLVHLDLSANQISVIDGLEKLTSLKTLNLSSNLITAAQGFSGLKSLERLNLSYNQIEDISGLATFSHPSYNLQYIALHGNKLREIRYLVQSLKNVQTLHDLVLSKDGSSNPLCHAPGYVNKVWSDLPHLRAVNGLDKHGKLVEDVGDMSSIPGLESYLEFLLSGERNQTSQEPNQPIFTPKIDAVIELFKQKYGADLETSSSEGCPGGGSIRKVPRDKGLSSPAQRRRPRSRGSSREEYTSEDDGGPVRDASYRTRKNKVVNIQSRQEAAPKSRCQKSALKVDRSSSEEELHDSPTSLSKLGSSSGKTSQDDLLKSGAVARQVKMIGDEVSDTSGTGRATGTKERKRAAVIHKTRFSGGKEESSITANEEVEKQSGDRLGRDDADTFYKD